MKATEFDGDDILTGFLTDYLDGNLNGAERASFEDYLTHNEDERIFTCKAKAGKKALKRLARLHQNTEEIYVSCKS